MTVPTMPTTTGRDPEPTYQPLHDLQLEVRPALGVALERLARRAGRVATRWRYYDGDHPQLWATERFRKAFGEAFTAQLQDNYCELAVDTLVHRLAVTGWEPVDDLDAATDDQQEADAGDAERAARLWADNQLELQQEEVYRAADVAGEAYVIVWPREDDDGNPLRGRRGEQLYDVALNDARNVYLHTDSSGRTRRWAVKVWRDTAGKCWRATVYYPEEVLRLRTRDLNLGGAAWPTKPGAFYLDPEDSGGATPFDQPGVPVFRFATNRAGRSRLDRLVPVQDKLNKLAAGKLVAAEFLAWPQRYALTGQDIPDDKLRPHPGAFLVLDPGGATEDGDAPATRVGEFAAADLGLYDRAAEAELDKLFTLAPLPRHLRQNPGAAPSGAAIRADESGFLAVVEDAQQLYGATWSDLLELLGLNVRPTWKPAAVGDLEALSRTVLLLTQAGVPLLAALELAGVGTEDQRAAVAKLVAEAQEQQRQREELAQRAALGGIGTAELAGQLLE